MHEIRDTIRLTRGLLFQTAELFDEHPKYAMAESVVKSVFHAHPKNDTLKDVLLKTTVLNSLYATAIFNIMAIAKHVAIIHDLDLLLGEGDVSAVDSIRKGHGIITRKSAKERDFYSFATKYCSFHNQGAYPIYDNLVAEFLCRHNREVGWVPHLKRLALKNYSVYKRLLDKALEAFNLPEREYKQLDKGLWVCAKYYYRTRKNVSDDWINKKMGAVLATQKDGC